MGRAKRFYLCNLIPLWEIDSDYLDVDWNRQEAAEGDLVELRVRTLGLKLNPQQPDFKLTFEIYENDFLLTGGLNDHILTIHSDPGDGGEVRPIQTLVAGQAAPEAERLKKVFVAPANQPGDQQITVFWKSVRVEDVAGDPEYFFDVVLAQGEKSYKERSDHELSIHAATSGAAAHADPELEKLYAARQLDDRHIDSEIFRARLEQATFEEAQAFLEKAANLRVLRYLYRLFDFLRQQEALKAAPQGERERITILLGPETKPDGKPDLFYTAAHRFFDTNPAGALRTDLRSLAEVRDHLDGHPPSNGRPWGEVNIVVHANHEGGMGAAVAPGEQAAAPYVLRPMVGSPLLFEQDLINPEGFLLALKQADRPVSAYLLSRMQDAVRQQVLAYSGGELPPSELVNSVVDEINQTLRFDRLYQKERFKDTQLSDTLQKQAEKVLGLDELLEFNRALLGEAYPDLIADVPAAAASDRHYETLSSRVVDCRTLLHIRGCGIGRNPDMLRLLSMSFGGTNVQRPQVRAPRHLQNYAVYFWREAGTTTQSGVEEYLSPYYFVGFPADAPPTAAKLPGLFRAKYPQIPLDWNALAPAADTRHFPYTITFTFQFRSVPPRRPAEKDFKTATAFKAALAKYEAAFTAAMKNNFKDSDDWKNVHETSRRKTGPGKYEIEFDAATSKGDFSFSIEVGPEPPSGRQAQIEYLASKYGRRFQEGYSWNVTVKDEGVVERGVRKRTLTYDGQRTIRRIDSVLQARLNEKLVLADPQWESLKKGELAPPVRQAFEAAKLPLSQAAFGLLYLQREEQALVIDPDSIQSWVAAKQPDQVKAFLEETLPEGPPVKGAHNAHTPYTDLRHFGAEIPATTPAKAWGQNVLPEPAAAAKAAP